MDPRVARKRALDAGIEAADAQLAELRKARRAAKEADARRSRREAREWALTLPERRHDLETVLAIFMLADYEPEPAVVFLRGLGRQYHWDLPKTDAELLGLVEAVFLAADLADLESLCDESDPSAALRAATACVAQWRSVVWCRATGVHPDTEAIALKYEAVRRTFSADVRPPLWHGAPGARKRGTRLRLRWGGRYGLVHCREVLPAAIMLAKVARRTRFATTSSSSHPSGGVSRNPSGPGSLSFVQIHHDCHARRSEYTFVRVPRVRLGPPHDVCPNHLNSDGHL